MRTARYGRHIAQQKLNCKPELDISQSHHPTGRKTCLHDRKIR